MKKENILKKKIQWFDKGKSSACNYACKVKLFA